MCDTMLKTTQELARNCMIGLDSSNLLLARTRLYTSSVMTFNRRNKLDYDLIIGSILLKILKQPQNVSARMA